MHHDFIENRTFDEIQVGDSARLERRLTLQDIKLFAVMSGNVNPAQLIMLHIRVTANSPWWR